MVAELEINVCANCLLTKRFFCGIIWARRHRRDFSRDFHFQFFPTKTWKFFPFPFFPIIWHFITVKRHRFNALKLEKISSSGIVKNLTNPQNLTMEGSSNFSTVKFHSREFVKKITNSHDLTMEKNSMEKPSKEDLGKGNIDNGNNWRL